MRVQVLVRLKAGVLDVQGKAVEGGISDLGYKEVGNVRVGRLIELDVPAKDLNAARKQVEDLCAKLLINPIMENYEIRAA